MAVTAKAESRNFHLCASRLSFENKNSPGIFYKSKMYQVAKFERAARPLLTKLAEIVHLALSFLVDGCKCSKVESRSGNSRRSKAYRRKLERSQWWRRQQRDYDGDRVQRFHVAHYTYRIIGKRK